MSCEEQATCIHLKNIVLNQELGGIWPSQIYSVFCTRMNFIHCTLALACCFLWRVPFWSLFHMGKLN